MSLRAIAGFSRYVSHLVREKTEGMNSNSNSNSNRCFMVISSFVCLYVQDWDENGSVEISSWLIFNFIRDEGNSQLFFFFVFYFIFFNINVNN